MPPHPSHRLNAWLVHADPDREPGEGLAEDLADAPARAWLEGGWRQARLDRPPRPHLYGNKQGGYLVRCPACTWPLAREAAAALARWRAGGGRALACPACGGTHALEGLAYRPAAAPGRFAVELRDVQGLALTTAGRAGFEALLGGAFLVVGSRG